MIYAYIFHHLKNVTTCIISYLIEILVFQYMIELYIYIGIYTIIYYMYLIVRPPLYNIPGSATAEKGTELNIFTEFNCAIHW